MLQNQDPEIQAKLLAMQRQMGPTTTTPATTKTTTATAITTKAKTATTDSTG